MYQKTVARELSFKHPDEVSAAYRHALFDDKPLRRYGVTPNQNEQALTIGTRVHQLVQPNQWGPHSYSRRVSWSDVTSSPVELSAGFIPFSCPLRMALTRNKSPEYCYTYHWADVRIL